MLHQIGIGTLGPVFRTYEPTRDRLVAVKAFRLDIVPEQAQVLADALSRVIASSLFHPSIVEPIAAGVEGTVAYRAEEYVAAESLDVAMRHYAPAPLEKALPFITQLAGAIDFARAAGVGHGGLHPRDIFMTPDDARATGFGVVEALEQVGIRAPIRRPYSAPERIDGSRWGTPADVFALAAITFELLTARRPAGTGPQIGVVPAGAHATAVHAVLARAMDDDPSKRYSSALGFAAALESAGRDEPGSSATSDVAPITAAPVVGGALVPESPVPEVGHVVPSPAEFEVEGALGPRHDAVDDLALEDADAEPVFARPVDTPVEADAGPFAGDFVDRAAEGPAVATGDRAAEESEYAAEAPMFAAAEREPEPHDVPERSGPAILPIAVTLVIGLLGGFAAGYFVGSRDRLTPAAEPGRVAAGGPAPAPTGPATPDKPGQYSEQKVTPAPAAGAAARAPAPVTPEAPIPARPRPGRPASSGHLVVRSTPPRASVTLNGKWRGRTPLTLDALPFGKYVVRVVQNGFRVAREDVTLSAEDASHTMNARLEPDGRGGAARGAGRPGSGPAAPPPSRGTPAVYSGSLYVDSRPRGATVLLDGRPVGQTPLSLAAVPIGSHVVRIEMAGRKTWTSTARVAAGKTERVTGSLEDKR